MLKVSTLVGLEGAAVHLKGSGGRYHPGHGGLTPRVPLGGPEPAAGTSRCLLLESVAGVVTVPHGWGRGWAGLGRESGQVGGVGKNFLFQFCEECHL